MSCFHHKLELAFILHLCLSSSRRSDVGSNCDAQIQRYLSLNESTALPSGKISTPFIDLTAASPLPAYSLAVYLHEQQKNFAFQSFLSVLLANEFRLISLGSVPEGLRRGLDSVIIFRCFSVVLGSAKPGRQLARKPSNSHLHSVSALYLAALARAYIDQWFCLTASIFAMSSASMGSFAVLFLWLSPPLLVLRRLLAACVRCSFAILGSTKIGKRQAKTRLDNRLLTAYHNANCQCGSTIVSGYALESRL